MMEENQEESLEVKLENTRAEIRRLQDYEQALLESIEVKRMEFEAANPRPDRIEELRRIQKVSAQRKLEMKARGLNPRSVLDQVMTARGRQ
jgi:phenylacetate-coenzyme A ligase PaaK-like adenylate-forming protein